MVVIKITPLSPPPPPRTATTSAGAPGKAFKRPTTWDLSFVLQPFVLESMEGCLRPTLPTVHPNDLIIGGWDISAAPLDAAMQCAQVLPGTCSSSSSCSWLLSGPHFIATN